MASPVEVAPLAYETVAASQTGQIIGSGAASKGDYIEGVLVIPESTSPGAVTLIDGSTSIIIFVGGATSASSLVPFMIPLGLVSVNGAWSITTGASVHVIASGHFN